MSDNQGGAEGADGFGDVGDVGGVGEEAAKLFGALAGWARDHGSDLGPQIGHGISGLATHAAGAAREVDQHLDTGAAECAWCPVCRTVHVLRQASPEVREHLAVAAASLMQAAAGVVVAASRGSEPKRGDGVERIDLDGDDEGDWPEDEL